QTESDHSPTRIFATGVATKGGVSLQSWWSLRPGCKPRSSRRRQCDAIPKPNAARKTRLSRARVPAHREQLLQCGKVVGTSWRSSQRARLGVVLFAHPTGCRCNARSHLSSVSEVAGQVSAEIDPRLDFRCRNACAAVLGTAPRCRWPRSKNSVQLLEPTA